MAVGNPGRFCVLLLSSITCCAILGALDLANAKTHGRRATEYTKKDSLRGGRNLHRNDKNAEATQKHSRIVKKTTTGKYRGLVRNVLDTKVATFLGMRYAEAPIGNMRFKKPVPPKKTKAILDATKYPNTCYQWRDNTFEWFQKDYPGTEMWNPNTPLSEDCLFLNVWAPLSKGDKKTSLNGPSLPVMLWIYGGGFYSGTSSLDIYDGSWLAATQEVVVVSVNYRVAALGFLTFGTEEAPGNAGLWDQNLGLRWVRDNIHHFRGDPSRITLFGESAGAASISMHMLSSHSNTLFQNAIMQSASVLSPWAVIPMKVMKERATNLATQLGCRSLYNDTEIPEAEMMTCMYNITAKEMVNVEIAMEDLGTARFQNAAVIDEDFLTSEAFEQLKFGKFSTNINTLAGFNKNEGNYFLVYSTKGYTNLSNSGPISYSQYHNGVVRALWGYPGQPINAKEAETKTTSNFTLDAIDFTYTDFHETLKDRKQPDYIGNEMLCTTSKNDYKDLLDHIAGDINFVCPVIDVMKKTNKPSEKDCPSEYGSADTMKEEDVPKEFIYRFLPRSSQTPWPEWMGTLHGYEIEFVFGIPLNRSLNYTQEEVQLSKQMMKYWTNFAKSGDPNFSTKKSDNPRVTRDADLTEWPEYDDDVERSLVFSIEPTEQNSDVAKVMLYTDRKTKTKHCSFWNDYYSVIQQNIMQTEPKPCAPCSSSRCSVSASSILIYSIIFIFFCFTHLPDFS